MGSSFVVVADELMVRYSRRPAIHIRAWCWSDFLHNRWRPVACWCEGLGLVLPSGCKRRGRGGACWAVDVGPPLCSIDRSDGGTRGGGIAGNLRCLVLLSGSRDVQVQGRHWRCVTSASAGPGTASTGWPVSAGRGACPQWGCVHGLGVSWEQSLYSWLRSVGRG